MFIWIDQNLSTVYTACCMQENLRYDELIAYYLLIGNWALPIYSNWV